MLYGNKLKSIRKSKNYTIKDVAVRAEISQSSLSYIENNVNIPTIDTLLKLLKIYDFSITDFFEEENIPISPDLMKLLSNAKKLTPEQLDKLNDFIKTL